MKKILTILLCTLLLTMCSAGCQGTSSTDNTPVENTPPAMVSTPAAEFTEGADGVYTYLDTETSPLPKGGVKIDLVKGADGYVKFTVTDDEGTETVDFYKFTPADSTMHRYRYVAAMGMKYNYYFDYAGMTLVKVTDADDEDVTESLKSVGRWDSAAAETEQHAKALMAYFETKFGMSIDDAVMK
jgi:hypothetical protein